MKKGQEAGTLPLLLLIGIILALLVFLPVVKITSNLLNSPAAPVETRLVYDQFVDYYKTCLTYETTDCHCGTPFDFSLMPSTSSIRLVPLNENMVEIQLREQGNPDIIKSTRVKGNNLCVYSYRYAQTSPTAKSFKKERLDFFYFPLGDWQSTIALYLSDKDHCVVNYFSPKSEAYQEMPFSLQAVERGDYVYTANDDFFIKTLFREERSCVEKKQNQLGGKTIVLHTRQPLGMLSPSTGYSFMRATVAPIINEMTTLVLSKNLGKVYTAGYPYEENLPDTTKNLLALYPKTQAPLAEQLIIISVRFGHDKQEQDDFYVISYVEGPSNRHLATLVEQQLQTQLNLKGTLQPVQDDPAIFLTQEDYAHFFDERKTLPAIFIDIVRHIPSKTSRPNLLAQPKAIAQAITDGVRQYLGETSTEDINLFTADK